MGRVHAQIALSNPKHSDLAPEALVKQVVKMKLEAAEKDVREGRVLSHSEAVREMRAWSKKLRRE